MRYNKLMRIPDILKSEPKSTWTLLLFITLIGAAARFTNINFGLPFRYRPDEQIIIEIALKFGSGDLNPHFFDYPSLLFYMLFFLYGIFFVFGKIIGTFGNSTEFMNAYFADPTAWHLIGRCFTAALGTACIPLTYFIGRKLYGRAVGLISAFWLALIFIHVRDSHFISTDIPMNFFLLCAFLGMAYIIKSDSLKPVIWTSVFIGLAAGVKYPAGALVVPLIIAILARKISEITEGILKKESFQVRSKPVATNFVLVMIGFFCASSPYFPWILIPFLILSPLIGKYYYNKLKIFPEKNLLKRHFPELLIAFGIVAAVFFITTPFALFDMGSFIDGLRGRVDHAAAGHSGVVLNGWTHHISFSLRYGLRLPLLILSVFGLVWAMIRLNKTDYVLLCFIIIYCFAIGGSHTAFARYAIPLVPLLLLLNSRFMVDISEKVIANKKILNPVLVILALLFIAPSIYAVCHFNRLLGTKDTRTIAAEFIEANIPDDTIIYMAEHGPELPVAKSLIRELHEYNLENESGYTGRYAEWRLASEPAGKEYRVYKLHNTTYNTYDIPEDVLECMKRDKEFARKNLDKYITGTVTRILPPEDIKIPAVNNRGLLIDTRVVNFGFNINEKWGNEGVAYPCRLPFVNGGRLEVTGLNAYSGGQLLGISPYRDDPFVLSLLEFDRGSTSILTFIKKELDTEAVYSPIDAFFVPWSRFNRVHRQGPPLLITEAQYVP